MNANIPSSASIELKFKDLGKLAVDKVAKLQRMVFLDISKRVIDKTPVDEGRARGGWDAQVDTFSDFNNKDWKGGGADAAEARAMESVLSATSRHKTGSDLTLANNVEYINYLNSGSSKQAPAGMTDSVVNDFKTFVAQNEGKI